MASAARMLALVSMSVTACGAFGSGDTGNEPPADAGVTKAADADATTSDGGSPITTPIRCGTITCPATTKCCLPLEGDSPSCIDRTAVCGARFGELLCSGGAGCETGSVCCVSAERNSGQTGFDIVRSYCVTASACPDGNLQHSLCDLGEAAQCPGKACKPYRVDSNGPQSLDVNPTSYATCQ